MNCIFCKIVAGELPSFKVYEDEDTFAFLDIAPINYGHVLVISKNHYVNIEDTSKEALAKIMATIKMVGRAIKEGLGVDGYNIIENNDPVSGQIIPHIHFHIIPRREGDDMPLWPQGKYGEGEADEFLEKIKNKIT